MASIIPGYEHDIFISYRQKDNKHDGWVTEFVDNLRGELESTFKEEISVYFDINPHDGLLETHDVDASLKEKLKCLIFIPIISRTYCDPKSFAWEHEFKAFVEQASQDQFGLKVKLPNGNVASRVLPVRIHDLDNADIKSCESVLGGVLRGIEFIYKESGIDKPLSPTDDEKKNLNNTKYRIQIIKVSHAIKEIIQGMKAEPIHMVKEKTLHNEPLEEVRKEEGTKVKEKPVKLTKIRLLSVVFITAILIVAAMLAYPKIFEQDELKKLRSSGERISVAVMPFQNMTNDTTWNVWQDGIQINLITSLSNNPEELLVRQTESINNILQGKELTNYASITPSVAISISQKLDAAVLIYGSINKSGSTIRMNAQLVDSKTEDVLKSFQIDGPADKILYTIDSLSGIVKDFLIITKVKKEVSHDARNIAYSDSPEAYRYFIYGDNAFFKRDWSASAKYYSRALAIDSNFIAATIRLSIAYAYQGLYDKAKGICLKVFQKRDQMPLQLKIYTNCAYAYLFETPYEELKYYRQLLEFDDQVSLVHESIAWCYFRLFQFDKVIPAYEKALEIYDRWGVKPPWIYSYVLLGTAYHKTSQYGKEKKLYKKAEQYFPNDPILLTTEAILSLTEEDTIAANHYIDQLISINKEDSYSEATIMDAIANIYSEADIMDKAEGYFRKAYSLEPENPVRLNSLAWFLIDKDRNVNEGLELIDKALELSPSTVGMLDTKGWGLYKQGKYQEALELLENAWDLKPLYYHELFLHIEAAKKAVASQKNN